MTRADNGKGLLERLRLRRADEQIIASTYQEDREE